ncbi:hypothetical protein Tco_0107007, partial [Tanacetum coccineum]
INTSVPSISYYKPPIGVVSSTHGSSPMASGSVNTTSLVERINKLEKQMMDVKLMLVDDHRKPLNKLYCDPVDPDSENDVEVVYDECARGGANDASLYEDKDYDIYDTYDIEGLTKQELAWPTLIFLDVLEDSLCLVSL